MVTIMHPAYLSLTVQTNLAGGAGCLVNGVPFGRPKEPGNVFSELMLWDELDTS